MSRNILRHGPEQEDRPKFHSVRLDVTAIPVLDDLGNEHCDPAPEGQVDVVAIADDE